MASSSFPKDLLKYTHLAKVTNCSEKGYVEVNQNRVDFGWLVIEDCYSHEIKKMKDLEGRTCAYVCGGLPFKKKRRGSQVSGQKVISWAPVDDLALHVAGISDFSSDRRSALSDLSDEDLQVHIAASWYVDLWQSEADSKPTVRLGPDPVLEDVIATRFSALTELKEVIAWLSAICQSPWLAVDDKGCAAACQRLFAPDSWPQSIFQIDDDPATFDGADTIWPYCGREILRRTLSSKIIAIDIESDRATIREIGWRNASGSKRIKRGEGLEQADLKKASRQAFGSLRSPCIVGHNLLSWDLPILDQHRFPLPENPSYWDTLISSWLLAPWKDSHALVGHEKAHQADKDASACYDLFEQQRELLMPCLDGIGFDTPRLIDDLFHDPAKLTNLSDRKYPENLHALLDYESILPTRRLGEAAWQKGCIINHLAPENALTDPVLSPEICRQVASQSDDLNSKLISIIVTDSANNDVHVRLSFIPAWLLENLELSESLIKAHADQSIDGPGDRIRTIYSAKDVFRLDNEEIGQLFADKDIAVLYPSEIAVEWAQRRRLQLSQDEMCEKYLDYIERPTGSSLYPVQSSSDTREWLLYDPPGLCEREMGWSLLPSSPDWFSKDLLEPEPIGDVSKWAILPRWRDGDAGTFDSDRIFITPDTANRRLLIRDLTHCVLNLMRSVTDDVLLLVALRWPEEAEVMQEALVHLGVSSQHPGSPLRHLENVYTKGFRVLACSHDRLAKYIRAAETMTYTVRIAVDEAPLLIWYSILKRPGAGSGNQPDIDEEQVIAVSDFYASTAPEISHPADRVRLTEIDIRETASIFLTCWLQSIIGTMTPPSEPCILLDSRLSKRRAGKAQIVRSLDIPFLPIEEILKAESLEVFQKYCFPGRKMKEAPNDYASYQSFLKMVWGYEDFKPGTQRPAIEKLLDTDRDILLKLPTGAGKSIIFHLPALLRASYTNRLTVVITPLQALMRDQAEGLWRRNFIETVDYLSGGRDSWLNHDVYQGILDGRLHMVFVAPERFRVPQFLDVLERRREMDDGLEFIVFDEVHCISEWGFEFRPDYLHAAQYVTERFKSKDLPGNPHRLLLTSATVTERNRIDLEQELSLGEEGQYENLPEEMPHPIQPYIRLESYDLVENPEAPTDDKLEKIIEIIQRMDLDQSAVLVFVQRRKDCHRISDALNDQASRADGQLAKLHALPFHAGLSDALKTEACDFLRERKANVLVCTKAFGMGMDIPHIHACIHHRPPTYIEDYLQEVGRIGRDESERVQAGHEIVQAALLYNQDDLNRNLGFLQEKSLSPPDLKALHDHCLASAITYEGFDKPLCLVQTRVELEDSGVLDEAQVSSGLFWLERMKVLKIEGRHPPFLEMNLNKQKARQVSNGSTVSSRIASALLDVIDDSEGAISHLSKKSTEDVDGNAFSRLIKGFLRGAMALLSTAEHQSTTVTTSTDEVSIESLSDSDDIKVHVSLQKLISESGDLDIDTLFEGLIELSKSGVIEIRRSFSVQEHGIPSNQEFWALLRHAVTRLLRPQDGSFEELPRNQFEAELSEWYEAQLSKSIDDKEPKIPVKMSADLLDRIVNREVYRAITTSLRLVRYAGLPIKESLSEKGEAQYIRSIPQTSIAALRNQAFEYIDHLQQLVSTIATHTSDSGHQKNQLFEVELLSLMQSFTTQVRHSKLKQLIKLVDSAGFYSFDGKDESWVTLVSFNHSQQLEPYDSEETTTNEIQSRYRQMLEKHDMQQKRALAMALLAVLPTDLSDLRKTFIDNYFKCTETADLIRLIEDSVGDIDDEIVASNPDLQQVLSQVRQERFDSEFARLNEDQKAVCTAPYEQNLLVNAGPGSGKTHVLTMRCAHLIHKQRIKPAEILVLAFNRAVVSEVKERIRTLFRELGYGRFAERLDVFTFHSFALRCRKERSYFEEDSLNEALHQFSEMMHSDEAYARSIATQYRAVLVDEFQDMNEDFYNVVASLATYCRGGTMVIGDDDQDVLMWNRRDRRGHFGDECQVEATRYFEAFQDEYEPAERILTTNYRSSQELIERTSSMISRASDVIGFPRMKQGVADSANTTSSGVCELVYSLDDKELIQYVREAVIDRDDDTAVLCRSNRECWQFRSILGELRGIDPEQVTVQGFEDSPLYQLRNCGALLDLCEAQKDYEFVDPYTWECLLDDFQGLKLADLSSDRAYLNNLYNMIKRETGRPRFKDIKAFIRDMRASDFSRLSAKQESQDDRGRLTISTIHKVKGLEFDTVIIRPSTEKFPLSGSYSTSGSDDVSYSAEEARLMYVAMTRARSHLFIGWGSREKAWWKSKPYSAQDRSAISAFSGSPKEVFISWPGYSKQVSSGLQEYLAQEVCIGDSVSCDGRSFIHKKRVIGKLSTEAKSKNRPSSRMPRLQVSNVIRYSCGPYYQQHHKEKWDELDDRMKEQGWLYIALISESL